MPDCVALIVAAGRGQRLGGEVPKQYRMLAGAPLLRWTARAFLDHPEVSAVRAVIHQDDRALYETAVAGLDLLPPVKGGASRQDSCRLGLESLAALAPKTVLIHDGARPFVDAAIIGRTKAALRTHAGAVAAIPVVDTLKRESDGRASDTVDRAGLWRAQTPQGFRFEDILAAHREAAGDSLTDDAAVAERAGLEVALVMGGEDNFKITTEQDLARAERLLGGAMGETRTGFGFDVHRFAPGDHVMLCGVKIPHEQGLAGHSDADVGLHALTDAVLGAIGAGDIGSHFPPSDPQWKGAPSDIFLARAAELIAGTGGRIVAVDLTVICEAPRIRPHHAAMVERVAEILGLERGRVSVKATTTEGLGFTGRGEGIAAQAVATVRLGGNV
ncbi:MAG: bifunctional 2-C-methyl-D-erythritol 4-phosphate cytidylyltransferase/2-C-methyl-D-erythritol 2,4-cyclodiphosphate synthase [Alphaproteobacteria bacterium]|nr:bifunctional 2-C-methyl-D-erythritol 4-phosphate cytidylyltransferase/2-C-methyl-D-erythritol 2,4-cyclodiphosphate synthase [Alphaproteobacteria bacterium]